MYAGLFVLAELFHDLLQVHDADGLPLAPDAAPAVRVYGPSGSLDGVGGPTAPAHTGTITAATNASPIVVTSTAHNLQTGARVTIASVLGNTAANGTFAVTRVGADTFSLDGSTGNGSYVSGGSWLVTGLYRASFTLAAPSGFDYGESYFAVYTWTVSGSARSEVHSFGVT